MAYRSPTLFQLTRTKLCGWLDAHIASLKVGLEQVRAAAAAEENARIKADVWPQWERDIAARLDNAECLREHVHPDDAKDLASEELLSIRANFRPVVVDIAKIRLSPLEEPDTTARSGYIAMPNPSQNGLIRAASSAASGKKWLGKRQ